VLFPHPEGPTMDTNSPLATDMSTGPGPPHPLAWRDRSW
jgi:hypothetical protein